MRFLKAQHNNKKQRKIHAVIAQGGTNLHYGCAVITGEGEGEGSPINTPTTPTTCACDALSRPPAVGTHRLRVELEAHGDAAAHTGPVAARLQGLRSPLPRGRVAVLTDSGAVGTRDYRACYSDVRRRFVRVRRGA
jgi:hypothetical protein